MNNSQDNKQKMRPSSFKLKPEFKFKFVTQEAHSGVLLHFLFFLRTGHSNLYAHTYDVLLQGVSEIIALQI